jgi:Na+/H+-dicarboxylate symporter
MAVSSGKDFKFLGLNMWQQVVAGLILGILAGVILKEKADEFKVLGSIFLKLIKMVVAPLIFFALVSGITSLSDASNFKGMAIKGTSAYLLTAVMAVCMGLTLGTIFEPGLGVAKPMVDSVLAASEPPLHIKDFLLSLIPGNLVHSMAGDLYIQIVLFAVFTGIVMNKLGDSVSNVKELNKQIASIVFRMIEMIVRLAPIAVFGFIASMVGTTGMEVITSLLKLVGLVILACVLQYLLFGLLIAIFGKISPMPFYRKMTSTQLMAFSTSSSKATLTTAMRELEDKMGVSESTTNFMMPLGACINMDGTAIYLGVCAMFFAQMYGVHIDATDYLTLILTCTLGSIGAAGVPSGSIIFMGMVLASVGIPMEGIGLILGVDRILDMVRTTVNITGDAAITLIIDSIEGELDMKKYTE